jgi:GDPmannose 4,6-dehydratase
MFEVTINACSTFGRLLPSEMKSIDDLLQPGDVVIIRGGYNSIDMGQFGSHSEWPHYFKGLELDNIHGTQSQPILVIGAPGERAWYNGYWSSLSVVGSQYLIVDGLEFNGEGKNEILLDKFNKSVIMVIDKEYFRPNEVDYLQCDYTKIKTDLSWNPESTLDDIIRDMLK